MTTEQEAPEAGAETPDVERLELPVVFMGREIFVKMPEPEQLLVWQRTVKRLTDAPIDESWTGSQVMAALERLRKIVDSIMVHRADRDWLDDEFLEGTVTFRTLAPFITDTVTVFQEYAAANGSRDERRAAKKTAKKAARKAPK